MKDSKPRAPLKEITKGVEMHDVESPIIFGDENMSGSNYSEKVLIEESTA